MKTSSKFLILPFLFLSFSLFAQEDIPTTGIEEERPLPPMQAYFEGCGNATEPALQERCTQKKITQYIYRQLIIPQKMMYGGGKREIEYSYVIKEDGTLGEIEVGGNLGFDAGPGIAEILAEMPVLELPDPQQNSIIASEEIKEIFKIYLSENYIKKRREEVIKPVDKIFQVVEDMPRFSGCEELLDMQERKICAQKKMLEFVHENVQYPQKARDNKVEGMVVIKFVVAKDGAIVDPEILRNIGSGCGEEALRVVKMMPNWIPGKQRGEPVNVYISFPVGFKL